MAYIFIWWLMVEIISVLSGVISPGPRLAVVGTG